MEKERGDLDYSLACKILDECASHSPMAIVPFFRGESLLHPQWAEVLEKMKSTQGSSIQFTTNASLLTPENGKRILEIGVDFISFSMDTLAPENYKRIRGTEYQESLDNVLVFIENRKKSGAATVVQVSAVESQYNAHEMEAFVAFWKPKVDRVRIYLEHSSDGKPGSLKAPPFPREERKACHKVSEDMVIYWNGDVALCNHDWSRRVNGQFIGNVKDQGVAGVWNSLEYQRIRSAHASGNVNGIAPCENCDHWSTSYTPAGFWGRVYE